MARSADAHVELLNALQRDVVMHRNRSVPFSRLPSHVFLVPIALLSILLATTDAHAQARGQLRDNAGESAFIEALRQDDPAAAERYVTLRDARAKAIAELERAQQRYAAVGPELRAVALPQLRQAQRGYAESTLAVLDFLDARDRRLLSTYQEQTNRINKALEERARTREDLQRMLRGD